MSISRTPAALLATLVVFSLGGRVASAEEPAKAQGSTRRLPRDMPAVLVHLEGPPSLRLEGSVADGDEGGWAVGCKAPCDAMLPIEARYRLAADGRRRSAEFALEASPAQRVVLAEVPGSPGERNSGVALIVLGSVALTVAAGAAVAAFGSALCGNGGGDCEGPGAAEVVGASTLVAGVALLVSGVLVINHGDMHYVETVSERVPRELSTGRERAETSWLPAPIWSAPRMGAAPGAPRAGASIFSWSF